jgi:hypothetical protein
LLEDQFRQKLEKLEDWEQTSILAALQRLAAMMDAEALPVSAVLDTAAANSNAAEDHE